MSAKKVSKGEKTNTTTGETAASSNTPNSKPSSPASMIEKQHQSGNKALDETKDLINRSIEEAGKGISHNTQSTKDYQEQTIQAFGEIIDSYLQSQKEIINSLQSTWSPYIENMYKMSYTFYPSHQRMSEIYVNTMSSFADNILAIIKLVNNVIYSNFDIYKTLTTQRAK
jgi:hypothetical protein